MARPAEGAGSPLHPDTSFESAPEVVQISTISRYFCVQAKCPRVQKVEMSQNLQRDKFQLSCPEAKWRGNEAMRHDKCFNGAA